jgi:hypothetical protein
VCSRHVLKGTDRAMCCHRFTTFSAARFSRFCSSTCSCHVAYGIAHASKVHLPCARPVLSRPRHHTRMHERGPSQGDE